VVASLPKRSPHPYSAISLSPTRQHAVTASNDTLQILSVSPQGMEIIQTIPFAPLLAKQQQQQQQGTTASTTSSSSGFRRAPAGVIPPFHRLEKDLFEVPGGKGTTTSTAASSTNSMMNVVINHVAWSDSVRSNEGITPVASGGSSSSLSQPQQQYGPQQQQQRNSATESFIAAAGSNGVIAIWKAQNLLSKGQSMTPEMVLLNHHVRAVTRLSWHPQKALLLSASLDSTVRLWERRNLNRKTSSSSSSPGGNNPTSQPGLSFSFFGVGGKGGGGRDAQKQNFTWQCTKIFEPRTEAVRDVGWNPFLDEIFALVTSSGSLIVYNRFVRATYMVKISAHDRDATTLDWHPTRKYTIATGGSNDRSVKVWNLQSSLDSSTTTADSSANMAANQGTFSSRGGESTHSNESDIYTDSSSHSIGSKGNSAMLSTFGSSNANPRSRQPPTHVLAVAAGVKRVKWRPPALVTDYHHQQQQNNQQDASETTTATVGMEGGTLWMGSGGGGGSDPEFGDRHESMLVVATAPVKGETSGGSGLVALWSYHRPYMPLSIVEGHKEGAVVDFAWLQTPVSQATSRQVTMSGSMTSSPTRQQRPNRSNHHASVPAYQMGEDHFVSELDVAGGNSSLYDSKNKEGAIWQHILSVGKDGRCLIQSLARGERPIAKVPPSCFAMANLSPFQRGCGSLQIFSVLQKVPPRGRDGQGFWLTGLRRDSATALAPGIFREKEHQPTVRIAVEGADPESQQVPAIIRKRIPSERPSITFNEVDQGDLDQHGKPITASDALPVAPEVVHVSRFAAMYVLTPSLSPDEYYPTRVHVCMHNADVARNLKVDDLAHMWEMIATMLQNAGIDSLADIHPDHQQNPNNVIQFAIVPTIQAILEDRANDGDVQTCVAVCEVLQVLKSDQTTRIPGLEIQLVREWYLSYIDLLRDMCLFSHACSVIRDCNDPLVSGLNKKSTTISESCPLCGKPILADGEMYQEGLSRQTCKSCHRRIGKCFLCHLPVTGMYVWCPGCGHGGHLEHALTWFGGLGGSAMRETCPTGCGHRCNILQTMNAFPRTDSMREVEKLDSILS